MNRFSEVKKILKEQPEEWLAYLHGQQFDNLKHLKETKPRLAGVIFRSLAFFYHIIRLFFFSFSIKKEKVDKIDFYFYAGTENQANSLAGTINSLREKNVSLCAESGIANRLHMVNKEVKYKQLEVRGSDLIVSSLLFFVCAPNLYLRLRVNDADKVRKCFNSFCLSYFYLSIFYRLINHKQPECIIVANDHNVDCRSLIAVAKHLNIKTAYMQHASVSNFFPALTVDYAFLDGESALDTYRNCTRNSPKKYNDRNITKIFLSGQKKLLMKSKEKETKKIGLAINALDNIQSVIDLISKLVEEGKTISLRWHPGQKPIDITLLKEKYKDDSSVYLCDPKLRSVNSYLAEINYMIAGNSSIHLEAAIAGVTPIYYDIQPPLIEDYYGYVKNGIAIKVDSYKELSRVIGIKENRSLIDSRAIQYYSASYETEWFGREGELVSLILLGLKNGNDWSCFFGSRKL